MTPHPTWQIVEAPLDADWALEGLSDVDRAVELDTWGHHDMWAPSFVWRGILADQTDAAHRLFVALPEGTTDPRPDDVAGAAVLDLHRTANTHLAHVVLLVRPGRRRRGAGRALLSRAEEAARAEGRTAVVSYAAAGAEPPEGPGALAAETGTGRVAADRPGPAFALRHAYGLEQVERHSVQRLPEDLTHVAALRDQALADAGPEYRLHTWHDEVPEQWLAGVATLQGRMSTDAPHGDLPYDPDPWDAERARRWVAAFAERRQHVTITAAEHLPSGALAGHTVLMHPVDEVPFAFQFATLVLREHRGRRLGLAVKAANVLALRERRPGVLRVHTNNAEENAHMLAINTALGYAPDGVVAVWRKTLQAERQAGTGAG